MNTLAEPNIHVLVVDDSAVVREVLTAILSLEPGMAVATASDPLIAMNKMKRILLYRSANENDFIKILKLVHYLGNFYDGRFI